MCVSGQVWFLVLFECMTVVFYRHNGPPPISISVRGCCFAGGLYIRLWSQKIKRPRENAGWPTNDKPTHSRRSVAATKLLVNHAITLGFELVGRVQTE